jgi:hypothetical protein
MEELTLRFKKSPTLKQREMAINVLRAIGMPAQIVESASESAGWIPTQEEMERIDRAKQSAREGNVVRLTKEKHREFLGL